MDATAAAELTEQRRRDLGRAVDAAWYGMSDPFSGLVPPEVCLPMCVLLQRVVETTLHERLHLRVGALNLFPTDLIHAELGPHSYDPRGSEDTSSGFHAWLESDNAIVVDPSLPISLKALGYRVDDDDFLAFKGRHLRYRGLELLYEELPDLEVTGLEASEAALAQQLAKALFGRELSSHIKIYLDVRWDHPTPI